MWETKCHYVSLFQPGDPLEQGHWLKVLITEAGNAPPPRSADSPSPLVSLATDQIDANEDGSEVSL